MSKSKKKSQDLEVITEDQENIDISDEEIEIINSDIEIEESDDDGDLVVIEDSSTTEETSSSSFSSELRLIENIILKGEKYNIYQKAIQTRTPQEFIFKIDGDLISGKLKIANNLSIVENYDFFYTRGIKIQPINFVMLFYIANKEKKKEYLIENFNLFKNIANKKEPYFIESFRDYTSKFENKYEFLMDETKKNYKKFENFYQKIDSLKSSQDINKIINSFNEDSTEIDITVSDNNYPFDVENAKIIFNNFQVTEEFPFIRMNVKGEIIYKFYTQSKNYETFIEENDIMEDEDNKIYIFYNISINNKFYNNKLVIDLNTSSMLLQYPSDGLNILKEKISLFYPSIIFSDYQEKNMTGDFEITFKDYNETKFYYLTLFDPIFSEFLFIRDVSSPRSLKENLKIYYVGTEEVRNYNNYSIYFNLNKLQGDKYLVDFTSKRHSPKLLKEFMVVLSKLISHYKNQNSDTMLYYDIITKPYTGIDGEGLGGKEEDRIISEKQKSKKKIDALIVKNKKLFSKNYYARSCTCQKQPVIISEEDVEDWKNYEFEGKKRNVVLFPPKNSTQKVPKEYYTCPDDEYTTLTLRQNPDMSSEYPLIPCCNISNFPEDLYRDYDEIRKNPNKYWLTREEYRGKGKGILKTNKILSTGREGNIPYFVENFLREIDNTKFIREGVAKNSRSSLLHILIKTYPDVKKLINIENRVNLAKYLDIDRNYQKYKNFKSIEERDKYISKLRYGILSDYLIKEVCSQETYEYTKDETLELFANRNKSLDSNYFYKILENIFCVNIFVFVFDKDKDKVYLETPNHEKYHIREIREELPSIMILKHLRRNNFNVYEAIKSIKKMNETDSNYVVSRKFTRYFKNYILNKSYYSIETSRKEVEKDNILVRKNPYSNINWNKILKDYLIESQMINASGRCFGFTFYYTKDKKMTLFIEPTFPFDVEESYDIIKTPKKDIIKIFGNDYIKGDEGYWFQINDTKHGFFIPCQEECSGNKKCKEYTLLNCKNNIDRTYENIKICKKNTIIFLQLIRWLYLLENIEYSEWKEKYMIEDKKINKEVLTSIYINIPNRFPQNLKTVENGIRYLNQYIPRIFDNNKIYLYPELYQVLDRNMLNYLKRYDGLELINKKTITNIFNNLEDFTNHKFTKIIFGTEKYRIWKNKILQEDSNRNEIYEEEDIYKEFPFVWRNSINGSVYFVQNNKENSKITSLVNSMFWKLTRLNLGYNLTNRNIWEKLLSVKENIIEKEFGWNSQKLKDFIMEKTGKETFCMSVKDYIKFIVKNRIPYQIEKEFSYIVYSRSGNRIVVTEKYIIDKKTPLQLYRYAEGGYCSLLDIV